MGLLDLFNFKKTNYRSEMIEYTRNFMLKYIKEFPNASDDVIPVFSNVNEMLKLASEKDVRKTIKSNSVNVEHATLNIIQNFAMYEIKPQSAVDFLRGAVKYENYILDLYKFVNKLKFKKGYISKQQFEENEQLAVNLSIQSPLGNWF